MMKEQATPCPACGGDGVCKCRECLSTPGFKAICLECKGTGMSYNGWKNYETWNVALWIGNDEPLYRDAVNYARSAGKGGTYLGFVREALANRAYDPVPWTTPDDVLWLDPTLDYERLDEMVREMGEE